MTGEDVIVAKGPNHINHLIRWAFVEYDYTIDDLVRQLVDYHAQCSSFLLSRVGVNGLYRELSVWVVSSAIEGSRKEICDLISVIVITLLQLLDKYLTLSLQLCV